MQFAPQIPTGVLADGSPAELDQLAPDARRHVDAAIASGDVTVDAPIVIRVATREDGDREISISNAPADIADKLRANSSLDEINAVLAEGLPEQYSHDGPSQAEDPIWSDHLTDNWGF